MNGNIISPKNIDKLQTKEHLVQLLEKKGFKYESIQARIDYAIELEKLQFELLKLQKWILKNEKRVVIIFEGRDAAGKGGARDIGRAISVALAKEGAKVVVNYYSSEAGANETVNEIKSLGGEAISVQADVSN